MNTKQNHPLFDVASKNLSKNIATIIVRITNAVGSTPRDKNTIMLVCETEIHDTIGGGQLEWVVVQKARNILGAPFEPFTQSIPLGPQINQCCGGRVDLEFSMLTEASLTKAFTWQREQPNIYIFGAGHTGRELVNCFTRLPVNLFCIDTRNETLKPLQNLCETICTPLPEDIIKNAPSDSSYIILTHDHHLDFLLTAEALKRTDAAYVGMIGSKTKKSTFAKWMMQNDYDASLITNLICPIGKTTIKDKRPNIIAALTTSEVLLKVLD